MGKLVGFFGFHQQQTVGLRDPDLFGDLDEYALVTSHSIGPHTWLITNRF